ncbi:MAG TPA: GTP-binding protein [Chromatiales bacterium]|nr:GTP-binding protein [Chromatiales bacterium]
MKTVIAHPVPTNIITGFLGAGKTTAILSLLRDKTTNQRWAVLVNEFGEIGIDASLLAGGGDGELFIREVPGGCMCCAVGLPMQVALNQLISAARPDRLLIEPTGLGHPKEIIKVLLQPEYRGVLDMRAVVTLVDARKIVDERYTRHETFRQQLEVADCVVANKRDLYAGDEVVRLRRFLDGMGLGATPLHAVDQAALKHEWLETSSHRTVGSSDSAAGCVPILNGTIHASEEPLPERGYLRKTHEQDGFFSSGWIFHPTWVFDHERLYGLLSGIGVERIKAMVITNRGSVGFNLADGVLTGMTLEDAADSRIEVIASAPLDVDALERQLLDCVRGDLREQGR